MTDAQKHHIRQLHKATEIIRNDPDTLSSIDRERVRLDLLEFQTIIGMGTHYLQTDADPGVPERYIKPMVEGLRDAFATLADGNYPVFIDMEPKDVHIRVHRCPREGCGNIFVLGSHARTDRMRYCSVRCSRLAATKAYRQRKAEEQERKSKGKRKVRRKEQAATRPTKAKKRGKK